MAKHAQMRQHRIACNRRALEDLFMNLTYRLDPGLLVIQSPVILKTEDSETGYENGAAVVEAIFEKRYTIDSITAEDDKVVICVSENTGTKEADWTERNVSLFDGN